MIMFADTLGLEITAGMSTSFAKKSLESTVVSRKHTLSSEKFWENLKDEHLKIDNLTQLDQGYWPFSRLEERE